MADGDLTPEILANWYTPKQVFDLLPAVWTETLRRTEIAKRIQSGTIKVAALRAVTPKKEFTAVPIQPEMWKDWGYDAYDGSAEPFWDAASYEKYVTSSGSYGYGNTVLVRFFGVRLRGRLETRRGGWMAGFRCDSKRLSKPVWSI
jgi:hypothetical protein